MSEYLRMYLEYFSIEGLKSKTISLWSITKDTDNPENQSKLGVHTYSRARSAGKLVRLSNYIGFV